MGGASVTCSSKGSRLALSSEADSEARMEMRFSRSAALVEVGEPALWKSWMTSSDFFCATVSNYVVRLVAHCRVLAVRTNRNMMTDWIEVLAGGSSCGCWVGGGRCRCLGMRLTMETFHGDVRIQMWPKLQGRPRSGSCRWIRRYPRQSIARGRAPCSMPSHNVAKKHPGSPDATP